MYLSVDVVINYIVMELNKRTNSFGEVRGNRNKTSYDSRDATDSCDNVKISTKGNVDFGALLTFVKSLKSQRSNDRSNEVS